jgi:hypothetical protein
MMALLGVAAVAVSGAPTCGPGVGECQRECLDAFVFLIDPDRQREAKRCP